MERNRIVLHSRRSWALTHCSPPPTPSSPPRRGHHPMQCCLSMGGGVGPGKIPLTISTATKLFFFFSLPMACWNISLGKVDLCKLSLSITICPGQHSPGFFPAAVKGVGAGSFVPRPVQKSVHLFPDAQVGKTASRSSGIWSWIPQVPQRHFCL